MMIRIASALVLVALALLLVMVRETTGRTVILVTFVGTPLLAAGILFYLASMRGSGDG